MRRYLVVANQTLGGDHLLQTLQQKVAEGPCSVHVLVPASRNPEAWAQSYENAHSAARARLDAALERFGALGIEVDGEVGDERVVDAINDACAQASYDEIILSTLPPGVSRWLGFDLISRVERGCALPVTHVTAAPTTTG